MDERTPRSLIQGVLTSTSVSKSARKPKTPLSIARKTPSAKDVALQMITRTRSATKRKAPALSTPSEGTTPRTLIGGLLQVSSASGISKRTKRSESDSGKPNTSTVRRKSFRQSIGKTRDTPRTLIENYLKEAPVETPVSHDVDSPDVPLDSAEYFLPTEQDVQAMETSEEPHAKPTDATEELQEEDDENNGDEEEEEIEEEKIEEGEEAEAASMHEVPDDPEEIQEEQAEITPVVRTTQTLNKSKWRDLVTPKELPKASAREEQRTAVTDKGTIRKAVFKKPLPAQRAARRKPEGAAMPSNLVKSVFQHFSKATVSKDALQAVEHGSNLFFKQMSSDLTAYCGHAGRKTIESLDVELLMKRQNFITNKQSLDSLVEKYLPLEYRKEIIPTVQSGNRVVPK